MAKGKLIQFKKKAKETKIAEILINDKGVLGIDVKTKIDRLSLINILHTLQGLYLKQELQKRQQQMTKIPTAQINPNKLNLDKK